MNKRVLFVAVVISILAGTGLASQAFAATTITIETDKNVYDHTDTIMITGTVFPVEEICKIAKECGAISVVDGCQGIIHGTVDVKKLDCEFVRFKIIA